MQNFLHWQEQSNIRDFLHGGKERSNIAPVNAISYSHFEEVLYS